MKVIVASGNPIKSAAVRQAFATLFPGRDLEVISVPVDSGVGDQPMSDDETRAGARRRAQRASAAEPNGDYWVGLEGGTELVGEQLLAFAWIVVRGRGGRVGEARSTTLPLPPAVRELVDAGMELGAANDLVFATANSKQAGGAFGLLTDGLYTRESIYCQTVIMALIPLVNPLYAASGV